MTLAMVVRLAFILLTLSYCTLGVASASESIVKNSSMNITDMTGRSVNVPVNPNRIICLSSGTLRQICYLRQASRVVGIEEFEKSRNATRPYILANQELLSLPVIGPGGPGSINKEPDLEKVLEVMPQVIFVSYMESYRADSLQSKLNIPVVVLTSGKFATFDEALFDSIRLAGKVLNSEDRANQVVSAVHSCIADLESRTKDIEEQDKPSVYAGAVLYKGVQGIESTDVAYAPIEWVNGRNTARNVGDSGHVFVNKETIFGWNPDIIFLDAGCIGVVERDIKAHPEFYRSLKAFINKKVFVVYPFVAYVTNVGTALADAYAIGKIVFPERFTDVELKSKADEIYTTLLGKPVYGAMEKEFGPLGSIYTVD